MNLLSGVLGVIFCLQGRTDIAFPLMCLAIVFDFFDGMVARLLHVSSPIGKELDSLADMVSFGVLPSVMMYSAMLPGHQDGLKILCYIPLFLAAMSALRLAKFNLDERQSLDFIGLATPTAALLAGSLSYYTAIHPDSTLASLASGHFLLPALSIGLGLLLVSEIPMFSFKFKKNTGDVIRTWKQTSLLTIAVIASLTVLLFHFNWSLIILASTVSYILINLLFLIRHS